jgi:outer membrane protein TolC
MFEINKKRKALPTVLWPPILAVFVTAVGVGAAGAQELTLGAAPAHPREIRRMTLEQAKQQAASASNPLARLGQLSVEKARQHRLGVQADYFPKLSAGFINLHYSDFLGLTAKFRRPLLSMPIPVPLFSQNQTAVNVSLIQPITPLLQLHQAVKIARADERIAEAKAAAPIAANAANVEETYYKLLIAQRRLTYEELTLRSTGHEPATAAASIISARVTASEPGPVDAEKKLATAVTEVRELIGSLDRLMGWPDDTPLELVPPDPLVENISLREIADKAVPAVSPEVVEAEQNVVKARAASTLAKLEYVPTVAAVGGFLFQNVIPLVPSNLGYGGAMVTYNLFDFGKREHAVKEARIQLEMAQIALQLTKAKVAAKLKESYFELERSRQLSLMVQKMGSSAVRLVEVSSNSESTEAKAARVQVEAEMFEAELAHRQAYARLKALMGVQ